eukprot:2864270-Prymnesium_polylepis.1
MALVEARRPRHEQWRRHCAAEACSAANAAYVACSACRLTVYCCSSDLCSDCLSLQPSEGRQHMM